MRYAAAHRLSLTIYFGFDAQTLYFNGRPKNYSSRAKTVFQITTNLDETFDGGTAAAEAADGGGLSLREAIGLANANAGIDLITTDAALFGQSITLTQAAPLVITDDVVLIGAISYGNSRIPILAGTPGHRLLEVDGATVVAAGFTLEGGDTADAGGGVLVQGDGVLTLANSSLLSNTSAAGGRAIASFGNFAAVDSYLANNEAQSGAALYTQGAAALSVLLRSDLRYGTAAADGGGVFADGAAVEIEESRLSRNDAGGIGGGVSGRNGANITIDLSEFHYGSAQHGGAIALRDSTVLLENSRMYSNDALGNGGAISTVDSDTMIGYTNFAGNSATFGGGIFVEGGNLNLTQTSVSFGSATEGGGIYAGSRAKLSLTQTNISDNSADHGGGLLADNSTVALDGVGLKYNTATIQGGGLLLTGGSRASGERLFSEYNSAQDGAGIAVDASTLAIENSGLLGNSADGNGGALQATYGSSIAVNDVYAFFIEH